MKKDFENSQLNFAAIIAGLCAKEVNSAITILEIVLFAKQIFAYFDLDEKAFKTVRR